MPTLELTAEQLDYLRSVVRHDIRRRSRNLNCLKSKHGNDLWQDSERTMQHALSVAKDMYRLLGKRPENITNCRLDAAE